MPLSRRPAASASPASLPRSVADPTGRRAGAPRRDAFVRWSAVFVVALTALGAGATAGPTDRGGTGPIGGGPTLAIEDTMHTDVPQVLVRAPRVTLDEILDRVARGEARRDSLLRDQSFTASMRVLRNTSGKGTPELVAETVAKVYKKKPDKVRTIELRHFEAFDKKKKEEGDKKHDDAIDSDFSPSMGEEIVNFAFRPENRRHYRFTIEDRKLLGDHLLYTLRFEPRAAIEAYEPSGRVWVDTKDFVILRQEIMFRQSPVPLFLKAIPRMVVERTRAGDFWVLSRALIRMEMTVPIPKIGRTFDVAMAMSDYTVNTQLPDSLFSRAGAHPNAARMRAGGGKKGS